MKTHTKRDRIQEALELLNQAAHEKQDELYEMVGSKYEHLKDVFENAGRNGHAMVGQARKQIVKGLHQEEKFIRERAAQWNRQARKEPWKVAGIAAAGALIVGFMLGRKH